MLFICENFQSIIKKKITKQIMCGLICTHIDIDNFILILEINHICLFLFLKKIKIHLLSMPYQYVSIKVH